MNYKIKKILIYSLAVLLIYIIIVVSYFYISKELNFHPELTDKQIIMSWFSFKRLILFIFPYLFFVIRFIRKK